MDTCKAYPRPARRGAPSPDPFRPRDSFRARLFGDFDCCHCGRRVCADPLLSGVNHRNHCPYCLWSRHMDLLAPGDRLCACKAPMRPVGLAFKHVHKRYVPAQPGELMLVHLCAGCGAVSLNRLAADDGPAMLWDVFVTSLAPLPALAGVDVLGAADGEIVRARLFGEG